MSFSLYFHLHESIDLWQHACSPVQQCGLQLVAFSFFYIYIYIFTLNQMMTLRLDFLSRNYYDGLLLLTHRILCVDWITESIAIETTAAFHNFFLN